MYGRRLRDAALRRRLRRGLADELDNRAVRRFDRRRRQHLRALHNLAGGHPGRAAVDRIACTTLTLVQVGLVVAVVVDVLNLLARAVGPPRRHRHTAAVGDH